MSASTRVMVFLDGPNIYRGREMYNLLNNTVLTIDYHKLLNEAGAGGFWLGPAST